MSKGTEDSILNPAGNLSVCFNFISALEVSNISQPEINIKDIKNMDKINNLYLILTTIYQKIVFIFNFLYSKVYNSAIENITYTPFGEVVEGGTASRYGYEGKEHDSVVGDTDFHFRKYKAEWALFTQPDTLIQNIYDPQLLNRYAFERNSPYNNIDEDGHFVCGGACVVGAVLLIGAGVGALVNIGKQVYQHGKVKSWGEVGVSAGVGAAFSGVALIVTATAGGAIAPLSAAGIAGEAGSAAVGSILLETAIEIDEEVDEYEKQQKIEEEQSTILQINPNLDTKIQANNQMYVSQSPTQQTSGSPGTGRDAPIGSSSSRSYYSSQISSLGWGGSSFASLAKSLGVTD